jgi:hypothetical protein
MRAFFFVAIFVLVELGLAAGDATSPAQARPPLIGASTNRTQQSYISDYRYLPIWFSSDDVSTRTSRTKDGQTIRLLSREVVKVGLPDLREMVVIRYGEADSDRTACIDFYATRGTPGAESYLLLCHDPHCPPLKTKVAFAQQGDRRFFTVSGESSDAGTLKRTHSQYSYELNNQWQMVEGFDHFVWEVH